MLKEYEMDIIEGRLINDPKLIKKKIFFCEFKIIIDKIIDTSIKLNKIINVYTFRNLAVVCNKYLKKGDSVRVSGLIKKSNKDIIEAMSVDLLN